MDHHPQLQHLLPILLPATPLHTIHLQLPSHHMATLKPHQHTLFQHRQYLHEVVLLLTEVCMTQDLPGVLLLITEVLHHLITEDPHPIIGVHHLITVVHHQIIGDHLLTTVAIRLITIREDLLIIEDHPIIEFHLITEDLLITEGHQITEDLNQIIIGLILLMGIGAETQVLLIEVVDHHQEEVQGDLHPIEDLRTVDLLAQEVVGGGQIDIEL